MRIGATSSNENYTDWDRYDAEERGESVDGARRSRTARFNAGVGDRPHRRHTELAEAPPATPRSSRHYPGSSMESQMMAHCRPRSIRVGTRHCGRWRARFRIGRLGEHRRLEAAPPSSFRTSTEARPKPPYRIRSVERSKEVHARLLDRVLHLPGSPSH